MMISVAIIGWLLAIGFAVAFQLERWDNVYNRESWVRCGNRFDEVQAERNRWHSRAQSAEHDLEKIAAAVRLYDKKREQRERNA